MIKLKIIYNPHIIDDIDLFDSKIKTIKEEYLDSCVIEKSNDRQFDLMIDNKIIFTLDDNFSSEPVSTVTLIKKIEQQIYSFKSLKRSKIDSKFDDIGLIDF